MNITDFYLKVTEVAKSNPILAAGVSLWGLTVLTWICHTVPSRIYKVLFTQCTTSLTVNNTGYWGNKVLFQSLLQWYGESKYIKYSRSISADNSHSKIIVGPGYGRHYMIYKKRLFWLDKSTLDSSGTSDQKESIKITMFGRDQQKIRNLIETFSPKEEENKLYVHRMESAAEKHAWERVAELSKRSMKSVVVPQEVLSGLTLQLDNFYSMREWYLSRGFVHKMCVMVHGIPGCGKTSLIKALASHYNVDLYVINVNRVSDTGLEKGLSSVPKGSFVILEDIDSAGAVATRIADNVTSDTILEALGSTLSLTGVLNALDGVIPLDNVVLFMTTNHIDKLDQALLRKGRTDLTIKLNPLDSNGIKQFIRNSYEDHADFSEASLDKCDYADTPGCEIQSIVLGNKLDYLSFKEELDNKFAAVIKVKKEEPARWRLSHKSDRITQLVEEPCLK